MWVPVLANRSFRNLCTANLLSMIGTQISRMGLILHIFHDSSRLTDLALLISLEVLPGTIVAPLAGAVIDRLDKRRVMVAADLARLAFLLVVLAFPTRLLIYAMAAAHSVGAVFFSPAKSASLALVVEKDQLPKANGIDQGCTHLMMILGPVMGAELYVYLGLQTTLFVDALSFLLSAVLISTIRIREVRAPAEITSCSAVQDLREGWRYLLYNPLVLHVTGLFFVSLVCVGLWLPLAPFFIRDFLGGSDRVLGYQTSIFGVGGVLGALFAPAMISRWGKGFTLFVALCLEGLTMTIYSVIPWVVISILVCGMWGVVVSAILVPYYSLMQEKVEDRYLGRVFSVAKQSESIALLLAMFAAVGLKDLLRTNQILSFSGVTYFALVAASVATPGGRELIRTR